LQLCVFINPAPISQNWPLLYPLVAPRPQRYVAEGLGGELSVESRRMVGNTIMRDGVDRRTLLSGMVAGSLIAAAVGRTRATEPAGEINDGPPAMRPTNDLIALTPRTEFQGRDLEFDFPSLQIGVADYPEGPTGCTVFYFPGGARCAADVRGGSPGTLMAGDGWLDALCFTGGSLYGLEAATGVSAELFARRSYATQWNQIAIVRAAVIFDFPRRPSAVYPDKALGRAALKAARSGTFPQGRHGAGCSASVGKAFGNLDHSEPSGQGGAFRRVGATRIAVFTVVNAVGAIIDRQGQVVRGYLDRKTGRRRTATDLLEQQLNGSPPTERTPGNTTLTAVITNQKLDPTQLTPLARQVHSSMSRAIQPFHAWNDGDVLYAISTNEVANPALDVTRLGILASELAWDAVLNCYQD
jgi:L-aminopeptidase/D-esterase-like protein